MPHNVGPFEFLKLFLTEEFFNKMVNKTKSMLKKLLLWVPVTVEEMKKILGVITWISF